VRDVFVGDSFKSTIGADFLTKRVVVDQGQSQSQTETQITLQLWDTAGQERFVSLCVAFYRGADALVLVYDAVRPETSAHLNRWHEEFSRHGEQDLPTLVLCNKSDLLNGDDERTAAFNAGMNWAKEHGALFASVSALSGSGVDVAMKSLATAAWARSEGVDRDASLALHDNSVVVDLDESKRSCPC